MRIIRNGFTLMELGVLLAVLALGMAYIAPDFMEQARGELSIRTAKEMAAIADASKWFYMNQGGDPASRDDMHWPGEQGPPANCVGNITGAVADLRNAGYLRNPAFQNPWAQPYTVTLIPDIATGDANGCKLSIATNVPVSVAGEIVTYMPMSNCDSIGGGAACPGGAPAGFDRCCAKVVRPGQEMILQDWIAPGNMCGVMRGGQTDAGTGKCDVRAKWQISSCYYTTGASGTCNPGYVAVGNRQVNCGKYCQQTHLKCCRGQP